MRRGKGVARADAGQSSIELLGLLPLVALIAICLAQLLATGAAHTAASSAAEAAVAALLQRTGDPAAAARAAAPAWSRDRLSVRVEGRRVHVRVRPRAFVPGTAALMTVTAEADAGPVPAASASAALNAHRAAERVAPAA
jgi:hypothetical protein